MKFRVTFKDPDSVADNLDSVSHETIEGLDNDEFEAVAEIRREKLEKFTEKWIKYGEYLVVEFDTEAETATVVKYD